MLGSWDGSAEMARCVENPPQTDPRSLICRLAVQSEAQESRMIILHIVTTASLDQEEGDWIEYCAAVREKRTHEDQCRGSPRR